MSARATELQRQSSSPGATSTFAPIIGSRGTVPLDEVVAFVTDTLRDLARQTQGQLSGRADSNALSSPSHEQHTDDGVAPIALEPTRPLGFITLPAPIVSVDAVTCAGERRVLWDPPAGAAYAGVGHGVELFATGPTRIHDITERADAVWARIVHYTFRDESQLTPRFFGGFAFTEGAACHRPWSDFGDARFVLPNFLYECTPGQKHARLGMCVDTSVLPSRPDVSTIEDWIERQVAELRRVLAHMSEPPQRNPEPTRVVAVSDTDRDTWQRRINDIKDAIARRHCDKIVAARCRTVKLAHLVEDAHVLDRLNQRYPDCYRFAYRFGNQATFVGATPERLIARDGEQISTQALAGSIAAGADSNDRAAAEALLASQKDRSEQEFVVQTIRSILSPLCAKLSVPDKPEIRELRHVLHLETPITGTLARPVHILELVSALHPTPAVGGVPTQKAVAWIAECEPDPRGWYAAPVGWFDARGQGEFAVGIRSGLLLEREAFIYAGAGIVRDSEADAELAETKLKERALLSALGIQT